MQYCKLTEKNTVWFRPLLTEDCHRLLCRDPGVFALGAVRQGLACGVLLFRATEQLADILYLATDPRCRRQGVARGLVDQLCSCAGQTLTAVACTFSAADWDDPLYCFFANRGDFSIVEDDLETGFVCKIPCASLAALDLEGTVPTGFQTGPFYALTETMQNHFFAVMSETDAAHALGLQEERGEMLKALCLCAWDSSGVQAAVFCQPQETDVALRFLYATPQGRRCLPTLLRQLRDLLLQATAVVDCLHIAAVTPQSCKLVSRLAPQHQLTGRYFQAVWDMDDREE